MSWIQHAQNDPLGNDLVDKRFIPLEMGIEEEIMYPWIRLLIGITLLESQAMAWEILILV